ncbi:LPS export ABC transporter protein LptC [Chryseobacterium piscicola]|uniref:LPS export ABC transporter protein LptC n=2 Tax=Chryseobacterium piscicola TaxID=551459 RepID=A0A1N7MFK9_9FLAO|nr:LPS export ABC transporter protein LptC [Chryseobacterium piscicola]
MTKMRIFSKNLKFKNIAYLSSCAIFFVITSCEDDLTKQKGSNSKNFPSTVIKNANIIQRDSGIITLKAFAPILEKYELIDSPYVVATKGMKIDFFDKKNPKPGTITAKYARIFEYKKFYEAKGDVKITTNDGRRFATQSVFWDQRKQRIYTRDTVYTTTPDGSVLVGAHGMTAKDDFTEYKFFKNSGDLDVSHTKLAQ